MVSAGLCCCCPCAAGTRDQVSFPGDVGKETVKHDHNTIPGADWKLFATERVPTVTVRADLSEEKDVRG